MVTQVASWSHRVTSWSRRSRPGRAGSRLGAEPLRDGLVDDEGDGRGGDHPHHVGQQALVQPSHLRVDGSGGCVKRRSERVGAHARDAGEQTDGSQAGEQSGEGKGGGTGPKRGGGDGEMGAAERSCDVTGSRAATRLAPELRRDWLPSCDVTGSRAAT